MGKHWKKARNIFFLILVYFVKIWYFMIDPQTDILKIESSEETNTSDGEKTCSTY